MYRGYIKAWRKINDNWVGKTAARKGAFFDLVQRASYRNWVAGTPQNPILIKRGELLTSTVILARDWGVSRSWVTRFLIQLCSGTDPIANIRSNSQYTIITICKYDQYQPVENETEQATEQQSNSERTASEHKQELIRTKKKEKKRESVTPLPAPTPRIQITQTMSMTRPEAESLVAMFGADACKYYKAVCEDWLLASGKRKKNYAAFMRGWIRRDQSKGEGFFAPKVNNKRSFTQLSNVERYEANVEAAKTFDFKKIAKMAFGDEYEEEPECGGISNPLLNSVSTDLSGNGNQRGCDSLVGGLLKRLPAKLN